MFIYGKVKREVGVGEGRKQQAGESFAILENLDNGVVTMFPDGIPGQRSRREKQRAEGRMEDFGWGRGRWSQPHSASHLCQQEQRFNHIPLHLQLKVDQLLS